MSTPQIFDCAIVGAGAAGLTSALYLARFRRNVIVLDGGASRASWIPEIHNYPGITGLSGQRFLSNLQQQAVRYGAKMQPGRVTLIDRTEDDIFIANTIQGPIRATKIIVASGIEDFLPDISQPESAVRAGVLRLCPVCDGYEAIDRKIACLIHSDNIDHALFLRTYSAHVTALIVPKQGRGLTQHQKHVLQNASIGWIESVFKIHVFDDHAVIQVGPGEEHTFHALYCLTGSIPNTAFLQHLRPETDPSGKIITDAHQQTSVSGLYAAGDITVGLCQISVATAQGATAACHIHSLLDSSSAENR